MGPPAELSALVAVAALVDPVAARPVLRRAVRELALLVPAEPPPAAASADAGTAASALRAAVRATGLTQRELAARTGLHRSVVSASLAGRSTPAQHDRLAAAIAALGPSSPPRDGDAALVAWLSNGAAQP